MEGVHVLARRVKELAPGAPEAPREVRLLQIPLELQQAETALVHWFLSASPTRLRACQDEVHGLLVEYAHLQGIPPPGHLEAPTLFHGEASSSTFSAYDPTGRSIKGLAPEASDALRRAGLAARDVSQGLGNAPSSRGTHLAEPGSCFTAAVDIHTWDRSPQAIRDILEAMGTQGFAAWYRHGEGWDGNEHIHAVYAGVSLKRALLWQVRDFVHGRRDLVGHTLETDTFAPSGRSRLAVAALHSLHGPHLRAS